MDKLGHILIVDDEPEILRALEMMFDEEYDVTLAGSGKEAISAVRQGRFDCAVLDIRMAKMDGLETASAIRAIDPELPIIFNTGFPGDYSESRISREHKPFEYVIKGESPERLRRAVRNAVSYRRLKEDSQRLSRMARDQYKLIGSSPAMLEVFQKIARVAPSKSKVMILGPTGTGKELVARAIHAQSPRADQPIATLNCHHKQSGMVESELFGHVKGAFTGAIADRVGLFEYADGGSVFLDEIGDLDIKTQAKLLRVLETGEVLRIGAEPDKAITIDIRLLCATHRDLPAMVRAGTFREDLYFRLKQVTITLPPLNDRREDIPGLIDHFIEETCAEERCGLKVFTQDARALLMAHDWPGNVRDLEYDIYALIAMSLSDVITADDVRRQLDLAADDGQTGGGLYAAVRTFRRDMITQALLRHNGNKAAAARDLRVDRANLRRMMIDLGIDPSQ